MSLSEKREHCLIEDEICLCRRGISVLISGAFERLFCSEGREFQEMNRQKFKCPGWGVARGEDVEASILTGTSQHCVTGLSQHSMQEQPRPQGLLPGRRYFEKREDPGDEVDARTPCFGRVTERSAIFATNVTAMSL